MFDFGFGELLLLAIIALVVLGPERLPVAARLLGRWIRAARSQWNSVKAELENEIADEELRRNLREAAEAMRAGAGQARGLHDAIVDGAAQMTRLPTPNTAAVPVEPVVAQPPADAAPAVSEPAVAAPVGTAAEALPDVPAPQGGTPRADG